MKAQIGLKKDNNTKGGSPGLVVMGGDSCTEGHGFDSQHCVLDGHFSQMFGCKNCNVDLKNMKLNKIEACDGQFLNKKTQKSLFIFWCTLQQLPNVGLTRALSYKGF